MMQLFDERHKNINKCSWYFLLERLLIAITEKLLCREIPVREVNLPDRLQIALGFGRAK